MAPAATLTCSPPADITIKDFSLLSSQNRAAVARKVAKLERKIFPSNESFDYDVELKKKNVGLLLAIMEDESDHLVGYLVYQRIKRLVWLHKLCVIEPHRKRGIGRSLVNIMQRQMEKGGSESIHLWVDEHRSPACSLYECCGFQQIEFRPDYYAPGRPGLKLELKIAR